MFTIEILDVIDCRVKPALAEIIRPAISFTSVFYRQGMYRKILQEYEKSTMIKGKDCFYFRTGLLPRVLAYCKERDIPIEVIGKQEKVPFSAPRLKVTVKIDGKWTVIDLMEEQVRLINNAIKKQRGVLIAPTASGKSAMAISVISAFPKAKIIWLCHTKDLMYQAGEVAERELKTKVGYVGDGNLDLSHRITMATWQSFVKVAADIGHEFDMVVCDEVHHLSGFSVTYAQILTQILAPVRIGLTATMPKNKEAELAIEAYLGPIADEITIREGQEIKIMSEISIRFLKVPIDARIRDLRKYQDVYQAAVVEREAQHQIIASTAKGHIQEGDSVLILVNRIEHGDNILAECKRQGVKAYFAQGATESTVRMQLKEALNNKEIHCLIATVIFKEGINIPELNVIINAAGGKSEISTLQAIGRGLRITPTKKRLIFYDIMSLDHYYLTNHLAERLSIYSQLQWLD